MRAEGACSTRPGLPQRSPLTCQADPAPPSRCAARGTRSARCGRSRASTCRSRRAGCSASSGPRAAASPPCWRSSAGCASPPTAPCWSARRATEGRLARCAYMPQRDLLLPWLSAIDNAVPGPDHRRRPARARPGQRRRALRAPGPGRLRGRPPRGAVGRHAPAGRLPAHADGRAAGAAAGRALRLARRDHARRGPGLAGRRAGEPTTTRSCSSPTTSRRPSTSPIRWW